MSIMTDIRDRLMAFGDTEAADALEHACFAARDRLEALEAARATIAEQAQRIAELESALGEAGEALESFARIEPSVVGDAPMPHYWVVIGSPDKSSFTIDNLRKAKAIREKIRSLCHEQSGRAGTKGSDASRLPNDQSGDGEAR